MNERAIYIQVLPTADLLYKSTSRFVYIYIYIYIYIYMSLLVSLRIQK